MTVIAVLALVCISAHAVLTAPYEFPENIDVDQVLQNDRLTGNYAECLLDKKPCSSEGQKLKDVVPEALKDNCAKCSEKNKADIKKILLHLKEKTPELWKLIEAKYDPDGTYKTQLEQLMKD